jgi:GNAT superfamily N-acetyltransferase
MDFMVWMRKEAPNLQQVEVNRRRTGAGLRAMYDTGTLFGVIAPGQGCMIGLVAANWYDDRLIAYEQMLFVMREYRGTRLAVHLIRAFIKEATAKGAYEVHAGSSTGIQDERTIRLYEALGFTRAGISVRKELLHDV